jgi:tetratricopeptide (TPR) repeat protein
LKPGQVAHYERTVASLRYYMETGSFLGQMGEEEGEIASYKRATELAPDVAEPHVNLGEGLRRKAIRLLERSVQSKEGASASKEAVENLLDDAIDEFKTALAIDPQSVEAHYDLGLAYAGEGLVGLTIVELEEALRLQPEDPEIEKGLASAFFLQGDYEQARLHVDRAKQLGADVDKLSSSIDKGLNGTKDPEAQKSIDKDRP